jgi:hypothetical protein
MKSYEIDGKIIKLPENLSEVTVKQLIAIHNLGELTGSVSDIINLINIFSNEKININTIDLGSILEISVQLSAVLFENKQIEPINTFKLNGKEYFCVEPEDLLVKEFIDFQEISKDPVSNLPLLLALVYKTKDEKEPADEEYTCYLMGKKASFLELPADVAQGCLVFFSNVFTNYVANMLESLDTTPMQKEILQQAVKKMKASTDGVGN